MSAFADDQRIRLEAFDWLRKQIDSAGTDVLPWGLLQQGFTFEGQRIPLVSMQGIFKPKAIPAIPLTIRTSSDSPYSDSFGPDGLLLYSYRGENAEHRDNVGLRLAMAQRVPLIYLHAVAEGKYLVTFPVFVVGDSPAQRTFSVAVDEADQLSPRVERAVRMPAASPEDGLSYVPRLPDDDIATPARRAYLTRTLRIRLHQRAFRERVLAAYRSQCALCQLRHQELLDAAHITPDSEDEGEAIVSNGLAMCKLHHAAYDRHFLTVRPDYRVEIRRSILDESDGPMLLHGLKELHGNVIYLPRKDDWKPDRQRLERRWTEFLAVNSAIHEGRRMFP